MWNILFLLCISLCLCILWKRRSFYMLIFKIPGPLGYPLIGMAYKFLRREDILNVFEENIKKYGTVFYSWLGPIPVLVVTEPQIVQDILTSADCDKSILYDIVEAGVGNGLFSLKSEKWNVHRKLLNPAFSNKVLISFLEVFNTAANELTENLGSIVGEQEYDLTEILQHFTLNIATLTTMGKKVSLAQSMENLNLLRYYKCLLENLASMIFSPWLTIKLIRKILGKEEEYESAKQKIKKFIQNLISEQCLKEDMELENQKIFINIVIDLYKRGLFTLQDVEAECNVIVFGAFETTANSIYYTLLMLAMYPQYQERVFEEVNQLFGESGEFEISYEQLHQLPYMDMVINETMRVMAPAPMVARETKRDIQLSNGMVLPKNLQIVIDIFHMQRRLDIWGPNAHKFDPDHFLPANLHDKHPYAFIPFTKGHRICIGWRYGILSMKVTLAKLIRNYKFETDFKFEDLTFVEDITVKLKENPLLRILKR